MKAVQLNSFDRGPDWISVVDIAAPASPGPDEVEVSVLATPINPSDLIRATGRYFHPMPLPFRPGAEGVGRITAVGAEVDGLAVGDLVIMLTVGNWVQRRTVDARAVHKVPSGADLAQLAMLLVNPGTAWMLLHHVRSLKQGDWIIQNAANSAVGTLVVRFARELGCKTVNVVRRADAVEAVCQAGGDVVVIDGPDLARKVKAAAGDATICLGLDAIAGDAAGRIASCLGVAAHLVAYGMLSEEDCRVPCGLMIGSELTYVGFRLRGEVMGKFPKAQMYDALAQRIARGETFCKVTATYPLDRIGEALDRLPCAGDGKLLLLPNGPLH